MRGPKRSARQRLLDILEAVAQGRSAVGDMNLEEFSQNVVHRYATSGRSKASRSIPAEWKAKTPEIPWQDVADIGNVIRHVYQRVDAAIIWSTVQKDFGPLEAALRALLADLREDQ